MTSKIFIGIDPDVRLLNVALIDQDKKPLAVFIRRNPLKDGVGDQAIANAAPLACQLVMDVIGYIIDGVPNPASDIQVNIAVESQSMVHTQKMRQQGKSINYESIKECAQISGIMLGVFSNLSTVLTLIQPSIWKKGQKKHIHHPRIYRKLGLVPVTDIVKNIFPLIIPELIQYSHDKINPGDFMDINDSLGLALWACENEKSLIRFIR